MKTAKVELHTNPNDDKKFYASAIGDADIIAQMMFAYMTVHPELLKKVLVKILDMVYGDDNDE